MFISRRTGYLASWFVLFFCGVQCNANWMYHLHISEWNFMMLSVSWTRWEHIIILFESIWRSAIFWISCNIGLCQSFYSVFDHYSPSVCLQRYVADVGKSWPVLLVCGGFLPLFLSIVWLLMIRHFVAGMPWVTVVIFNVLIVSVTMFFYLKGWFISLDISFGSCWGTINWSFAISKSMFDFV